VPVATVASASATLGSERLGLRASPRLAGLIEGGWAKNQRVRKVGDEVRADFRAEQGSVRLLSVPNSPKRGDAEFRGRSRKLIEAQNRSCTAHSSIADRRRAIVGDVQQAVSARAVV
jgi:hypothetical protein